MSRAPFTPPTHAARCSRSVARKSTTPFPYLVGLVIGFDRAVSGDLHRPAVAAQQRQPPAGCGRFRTDGGSPQRPAQASTADPRPSRGRPDRAPIAELVPAPARQQPNGERAASPARIAAAHLTECAAVLEIGGIAHRNTGVVGLLLEPLVEVLETDRAELDVVDRERPCRPDAADEGDGIADLHPRAGCRDQ